MIQFELDMRDSLLALQSLGYLTIEPLCLASLILARQDGIISEAERLKLQAYAPTYHESLQREKDNV